MNSLIQSKTTYTALALMSLMAITRLDHFGSAIALPDASLAVFFLAGFWVASSRLLMVLLLQAALIDYVAITHMGVSSYCISPAYAFLIPTYSVVWWAGRIAQQSQSLATSNLLRQLALLIAATTTAFIISNGSFYTLSGKFADLSWLVYSERVSQYFLPYITSTLGYSMVIIAGVKALSYLKANHLVANKSL